MESLLGIMMGKVELADMEVNSVIDVDTCPQYYSHTATDHASHVRSLSVPIYLTNLSTWSHY